MTSRLSEAEREPAVAGPATKPLKIVIAGGFAAGKTTFVDSISEITPLTTEAPMTNLSVGIDDRGEVTSKTTTTVAMDFGRITLSAATMLYLFGTPGQDRFWFMWDELSKGAVGAVVLVDTRRLQDCFAALDYFEAKQLPYVVALNAFDGSLAHSAEAVREALTIEASIPVLSVDARSRADTKAVLVELVRYAIRRKQR
ncbi:MAG: ATP/GTP-binding protein [Acidimicrobiales bacterium]|nr:ATP/GTP-binding protein [Acidimicrobiales bacterium]